jgi:superoxide dismutase, Fe-Mn family
MMTRRQAIKTTAFAGAAFATLPGALAQPLPTTTTSPGAGTQPLITTAGSGPFTLPPLPYAYDALEPHIDARTMEIHHDKHHAAYVANLNKAVAGWPEMPDPGKKSVADLLKDLNAIPEKIRPAVRNNGGGHYNHSLFWQMMKKDGGGQPVGELARAIDSGYGSFSNFKTQFAEAATKVFGSGWAWLILQDGKLAIQGTPNQDSPISSGATPLLGLDVWEHAYYLKYQNKRADYIAAWWNVVNWDFAAEQFRSRTHPPA